MGLFHSSDMDSAFSRPNHQDRHLSPPQHIDFYYRLALIVQNLLPPLPESRTSFDAYPSQLCWHKRRTTGSLPNRPLHGVVPIWWESRMGTREAICSPATRQHPKTCQVLPYAKLPKPLSLPAKSNSPRVHVYPLHPIQLEAAQKTGNRKLDDWSLQPDLPASVASKP